MPLALAFIIGVAATSLIQALVSGIIMPFITFFIPGGAWRNAALSIGPVVIGWGVLLGAIINFLVIALVVFMIARHFFKEEKVSKK